MKNKTDKAPALRCEAMVRCLEWSSAVFMAIASVGTTGGYKHAVVFLLMGIWLHQKNNEIAELKRQSSPNAQAHPRDL